MGRVTALGLMFLLFCCTSASAEPSLCPPLKPLPPGVDDLRIKETDFTAQAFEEALSLLSKITGASMASLRQSWV